MSQLYAVEYRNFRTAVHGLFVYDDRDYAEFIDRQFNDADDEVDLDADPILADAVFCEDVLVEHVEEIHYNDVDWDNVECEWIYRSSYDHDISFIVVNTGHIVPDIFGL